MYPLHCRPRLPRPQHIPPPPLGRSDVAGACRRTGKMRGRSPRLPAAITDSADDRPPYICAFLITYGMTIPEKHLFAALMSYVA
jgi:hypothetical protein